MTGPTHELHRADCRFAEGRAHPRSRKRLKQALSIVMGTEAVIAVRDISRANIEESLDATAWAARALVRQALAEDEQAR